MAVSRLYIGTYVRQAYLGGDQGPSGHAEGIYAMTFDEGSGLLLMERVYEGIANASFLAISQGRDRLYAVRETDTYQGLPGGAASVYATLKDGGLQCAMETPSGGASPCHVALSPDGGVLCIANYGGGSISACRVNGNGLAEMQTIRHMGKGLNAARQEGPHVHSACFTRDGKHVIAADLGTDTLTAYRVQPEGEPLAAEPVAILRTAAGDGPRMCAYHPMLNRLYVVCELSCTVLTVACDGQGLPEVVIGRTPMIPVPYTEEMTGVDLRFSADGRYLYTSARGHNSLSVFAAASDTGMPTMAQNTPCGGKTPRGFTLSPSGNWLLCGNQDSDTVTVFVVDKEKGTLRQHATVGVPTPVCLLFD